MRKGIVRDIALPSLLSRRSVLLRAVRTLCVAGFPLQSTALAFSEKAVNYPQVRPRALQFPRDFGAHSDFRTEWWYITGWLGEGEKALGFQVTFFRNRTQHPEENPSRFAPKQLLFAHAALAIAQRGELLHADRAARAGIAGVSFSETDTGLQMNDWGLRRAVQSGREVYIANMNANAFSLAFEAQAFMPPVLRGESGYSQKGPLPERASFYYSRPQLQVSARVGHSGSVQQLSGRAWLDHEWSSSLLMPGASGWDWIGINLFDGGSLMAFRIRDAQGQTLWRHVDWRDAKGNVQHRSYRDGDWRAVQRWRSPRSLIEYAVRFTLAIQGLDYEIVPVMNDQEVDARASTGGFYWEGAVTLLGRGKIIGRGYLELTGYGEPLAL